jgi:hypothetical protein
VLVNSSYLRKHLNLVLTLKTFLASSSSVGLSPIFQISKPFDFGFGALFSKP